MTARLAAVADAACIVAFAAMGRASHDEGSALGGTLATAAPFLIGGAAGWALGRAWRRPLDPAAGAAVWAGALVVGMALRNLAWDRGTAPSFVVVTAIVLGLLLLGWRAAWRLRARRVSGAGSA
ncbi:DUF3054 domain-containing protein [Miltoncostaea marina]|uniref:DUF3054 domain-containing protein n=1 Tax=Miltoncostaea marina TaxID=2843215 RepID=UPI001C3D6C90|nr:DUF3054 domain-containing protein [Miltoncostaea marina]